MANRTDGDNTDLESRRDEDGHQDQDSSPIVPTDNGYAYGSFPSYKPNTGVPRIANDATIDAPEGLVVVSNGAATKAKHSVRAIAPDLVRGLLMAFMAFDHVPLMIHSWPHGTGAVSEADGQVVHGWNRPAAYVLRTLSHFCAPGFTLLLGMGIVYLTRSRKAMGWSDWRLARYFLVRGLVLTAVTVVMGTTFMGKLVFFNPILFALGANYFFAGVIYLVLLRAEAGLTLVIHKMMPKEDEEGEAEQPLLSEARQTARPKSSNSVLAERVSWHALNVVLAILSVVTIYWNFWLSPNGGRCHAESSSTASLSKLSSAFPAEFSTTSTLTTQAEVPKNIFFAIWFYQVNTPHVMSAFPPLAWISFAILGLLYGRIITAIPRPPLTTALAQALAGLAFFILFVLTRVLQFGNLSENCLHTPAQESHPGNPYLASVPSFFYIIKYPPDLAFWAFTLAGVFFMLAAFTAIPTRISRRFTILLDFGTAALFFYVVHLYLFSIMGALAAQVFGHEIEYSGPDGMVKEGKGITSVWGFWAVWLLGMLIIWPLCRWFSRFKSTKPADSLWRFF